MVTVLDGVTRKARKDYSCVACEAITTVGTFDELIEHNQLTEKEVAALIRARANGYKVLKGEMYERWACIVDGQIFTCRAIPEIAQICSDYELWSEE